MKDKTEEKKEEKKEEEKSLGDRIKSYFHKKTKLVMPKNLDEDRTIEEIITSKGFKVEKHYVKTPDGYSLTIFRIPGGKNCSNPENLPPVLFQHGVIDSSDGWLCNGEEKSIPFVLANKGFDIWLSNSRGNKHSKSHIEFGHDSYEFWDFSFHELGTIDLPAVIDYIKKINKSNEKIIYFGHSQGTALIFCGLASKFDYFKQNLKLVIALAPVARLSHISAKILNFLTSSHIDKLLEKTKTYEIGYESKSTKKFFDFTEDHFSNFPNLILDMMSDSGSEEFNNLSSINVYMKHYPAGSSLKCFKHFMQIIKSKKFTMFDYGKDNLTKYGQAEAPEYDLSVIKDFPIMLIGGQEDRVADPDDVKWLQNVLGNNVIYYQIVPKMGHISFLCGNDFSWFDKPLEIILEKYMPAS